eukprot:TRINITY_DN5916_c0_g1_i1.p1 TRINITY_DN5916_c0_g1~~TRINITY_DN5916_c0_g1_i1.p1  ORF type:complete len:180 (+),score=50.58 TRINITY_DN5916_c0_g1_i1:109-648(+)
MGSSPSRMELRPSDIQEMQVVSHFTSAEIKQLYQRFKKLDRDDKGSISADEFLSIPELAMNPLVMRVIDLFDKNGDDQINFKMFIETLSVFSTSATQEEKMKFAFSIYDTSGDGYLDDDELYQVLKVMVGNNLPDFQLRSICKNVIVEADEDGDGLLSYEEFADALVNFDIPTALSINF